MDTHLTNSDIARDKILRQICAQIQITESQHALAEKRYLGMGTFLSGSSCPLSNYMPTIYPQGSFKIQTTNRPKGKEEFDLDFVCEFRSWLASSGGPDRLLQQFYDCIKRSTYFNQFAELKKRCVRLRYPGYFHMDILPAIPDPYKGGTCIKVPDRELHNWTDSNPREYANWFESIATLRQAYEKISVEPLPSHESAEKKETLKVVVQLLKRARDIAFSKRQFDKDLAPASIVLTTLAARLYQDEGSVDQAISKILARILCQIENARPRILTVVNPTNEDEIFSEQWEQNRESYRQFVLWIQEFANAWRQLLQQQGLSKIKQDLEKLFGDEVTLSAFSELAEYFAIDCRNGQLGILPGRGIVTIPTAPNVIPTKRHTYYGE